MDQIRNNNNELKELLLEWSEKLMSLNNSEVIRNSNIQNRTIKQIVGHMVDSATNNIHRIVHLQYQKSPLTFPNYATHGNNDRWIAIQNYNEENWENLVNLWKYIHLHFIHVSSQINTKKLNQFWDAGDGELVSLQTMAIDFLRHFKLHISEINDLLTK